MSDDCRENVMRLHPGCGFLHRAVCGREPGDIMHAIDRNEAAHEFQGRKPTQFLYVERDGPREDFIAGCQARNQSPITVTDAAIQQIVKPLRDYANGECSAYAHRFGPDTGDPEELAECEHCRLHAIADRIVTAALAALQQSGEPK